MGPLTRYAQRELANSQHHFYAEPGPPSPPDQNIGFLKDAFRLSPAPADGLSGTIHSGKGKTTARLDRFAGNGPSIYVLKNPCETVQHPAAPLETVPYIPPRHSLCAPVNPRKCAPPPFRNTDWKLIVGNAVHRDRYAFAILCDLDGSYTLSAQPSRFTQDGTKLFCTDQSGKIGCRLQYAPSRGNACVPCDH